MDEVLKLDPIVIQYMSEVLKDSLDKYCTNKESTTKNVAYNKQITKKES